MLKLVFLRHGQSTWNLENKFTRWTNVDLSDQGILEAHEAGKLLRAKIIPLMWLTLLYSNVPKAYAFWLTWYI